MHVFIYLVWICLVGYNVLFINFCSTNQTFFVHFRVLVKFVVIM